MAGQITRLDDPTGGSGRPQEPGAGGATPAPHGDAVRHVRSSELFGTSREVVIQHEQHVYRLKQTSRGGLILTK
jgi:hemin uptake protein HemP